MITESGVYTITNTINGNCYVGSATVLTRRWKDHLRLLRKGAHYGKHLQNAFTLYKEQSFVFGVLEHCPKSELIKREQFWIDKIKSEGIVLYNICPVAGNTYGRKHTATTKRKISESHIGKKISNEERQRLGNLNWGRKLSEQTKQKISQKHKGKKLSNETRHKMSLWRTGKKHSEETRKKMSQSHLGQKSAKGFLGKKHTEEHKQKMSKLLKGRKFSEETLRRMSESKIGKKLTDETKKKISETWKRKHLIAKQGGR